MLLTVKSLLTQIINHIITPYCAFCYILLDQQSVLCSECKSRIKPVVSCAVALTPSIDMQVYALGEYQDPLKRLILAKKWGARTISAQLGTLLAQLPVLNTLEIDYLIPTPLHWSRYATRGYNQSQVMANIINKTHDIAIAHPIKRAKRTAFQTNLDSGQRMRNVNDAFILSTSKRELYKNRHLVLIDDVMTTGATLRSIARTLLALKPSKISALVVSRVR